MFYVMSLVFFSQWYFVSFELKWFGMYCVDTMMPSSDEFTEDNRHVLADH